MCRNIRTLFNFDPPATEEEIRAASVQFVRKVSGMRKPSKTNEAGFEVAVQEVGAAVKRLLGSLAVSSRPKDREVEAAKAKERRRGRPGAVS